MVSRRILILTATLPPKVFSPDIVFHGFLFPRISQVFGMKVHIFSVPVFWLFRNLAPRALIYARYARRCGVIRTDAVTTRTTLLLLRFRYHIIDSRTQKPMLAEECIPVAFEGHPGKEKRWLKEAETENLLKVIPSGNEPKEQIESSLNIIVDGVDLLQPSLDEIANKRAAVLQDSHDKGRKAEVKPQLPVDILGFYVYLP